MDRCRRCPGQNSNSLQEKNHHKRGAERAFSTRGKGFMRSPRCKAYFTGKDWKLRIPLSALLCSVTLRFSTGQLGRKKGKATSLCQQHRLTCKQPYRGRKSLSLARRDTTSSVHFYALVMSHQKVKLRYHWPQRCKQKTLINKLNQSTVALSVETTHTVYRNEELKARTEASDIHLCMHGRF